MSGATFSRTPVKVALVNTKYRKIVTSIPVPESLPLLDKLDKYESTSMHGQMPVVWDRADGFQVFDAWGNQWIDFTSTIFVANAGHGNPHIICALKEVLDKPLLHTYTYASKERVDYHEYLINSTPANFEKAFLLSAGTEATECALKLMRMNGYKKGKKRPGIICFEGNWHGRTLGAQMMGYNPAQKEWIGYLDPNIYHLPFPYAWRQEAVDDPRGYFRNNMASFLKENNLTPDDLCGFMMETFQGWAAAFYPPQFVQEVVAFAKENNMLVAFDEMQAGFGRTGKLFGYMHYGVEPDIICCGKGASSSLPLSIVLGRREVMDLPEVGSMSSTHSANPMVCAAGLANLRVLLEAGLIEKAAALGNLFHARLNLIKDKYPSHIRNICGIGLIAGLVFCDKQGKPLVELCTRVSEVAMRKGLLVVCTGRESIKLGPPLSISEDAMLEGLSTLDEAIGECIAEKL
jgi:4-aminobutyrate aminotransferase/(S)-3-amino-2-methylpropionate transaminase